MNSEDPDFDFVMSALDIANADIQNHGWENIRPEQRHLANVIAFYGKVENAGFGGFYFDSEHLPDMLEDLVESLNAVGAVRARELLQQSMQKFEGGAVPVGIDARIEVAQTYPDEFDPFEGLDTEFYSEAESYIELLAHYIRANSTALRP